MYVTKDGTVYVVGVDYDRLHSGTFYVDEDCGDCGPVEIMIDNYTFTLNVNNGIPQTLFSTTDFPENTSICVHEPSGEVAVVAGHFMWFNGELIDLLAYGIEQAYSVVVKDYCIYIAGRSTLGTPGLWSSSVGWDNILQTTEEGTAVSLYVTKDRNTYAVGDVLGIPTLWTNGVPKALSTESSTAYSIFVKE